MDAAAVKNSSLKTLFIILKILTTSTLVYSQITIEQSEFLNIFSPGNPLSAVQGESSLINIGKDGGPNIYDFTFIDMQDTIRMNNYAVSTIPVLAERYPLNAHTFGFNPLYILDNPVIYSSNDSSFFIGAVTIENEYRFTHYAPFELYSEFPITYGSSFNQLIEIRDTTYDSGWQIKQTSFYTSQQEMTVDGYGILKLPGIDLECLRQKREYEDYGFKDFHFITREGILLVVDHVSINEPDTGFINGDYQLMRPIIVGVDDEEIVLKKFILEQNYPNPFNPSTKIKFTIPSNVKREMSNVVLKVYDILGNEVATLVNEELPPGKHEVEFNIGQESVPVLKSGVYFYQLKTGGYLETKKMLLLK